MLGSMKESVSKMFHTEEAEFPEIPLDVSLLASDRQLSVTCPPATDLTGKPKVWFVFGAGSSGKSTWLSWGVERSLQYSDDGSVLLASTDLQRQTLKLRFPDTKMPPSVDETASWLRRLLSHVIEHKMSAAIDFGADATLVPLLATMPDLARVMGEAGVEPVAFYMLTPRQTDLTVLQSMEAAGFRPAATCLVLNMGRMSTASPEAEFAQVRNHSVYRAAIARGAHYAWMPRLYDARMLENRRLGFWEATSAPGIGLLEKHAIATWISYMERVSEPWKTWHLP